MYVRYAFDVRVWLRRGFGVLTIQDYTGKFVRSLLCACSRKLCALLSSPMSIPKPLSISPLFRFANGKVEALYPGSWTPSDGVEYPMLNHGEVVRFYLGLGPGLDDLFDEVVSQLDRGVSFEIYGHCVRAELVRYEFVAAYDPEAGPVVSLSTAESITIVFMSPAILVNPWRRSRFSRCYKHMMPTPLNIFYVNALDLTGGNPDKALQLASSTERVFTTPPTVLRTVKIRYYLAGDGLKPGIVGYIKLYVTPESIDDLEATEHLLSHAIVMGVGSGRAAGFGTISVKIRHGGFTTTYP